MSESMSGFKRDSMPEFLFKGLPEIMPANLPEFYNGSEDDYWYEDKRLSEFLPEIKAKPNFVIL